jgi:hypothetical protein
MGPAQRVHGKAIQPVYRRAAAAPQYLNFDVASIVRKVQERIAQRKPGVSTLFPGCSEGMAWRIPAPGSRVHLLLLPNPPILRLRAL